jgi:iron complex transport system permease protein
MAMLAPAADEKADALASAYRRIVLRRLMVLALAATGLLLSFLLDVATGPARLPLGHVAASVFRLAEDSTIDAIVWNIRLPVAVIALLVGACLGLSGVIMQTILNNPLASSYTLGVSAGAGFGAGLVILMGSAIPLPEAYAIPLNAFLFAGIACAGVYFIGKARGATPEMLVLAGIAMLFLFQALCTAAIRGLARGLAIHCVLAVRQLAEGDLAKGIHHCRGARCHGSIDDARPLEADRPEAWR